ncbi:MAG: serine/threonine-protein kinase [Myxococcota bacterium]
MVADSEDDLEARAVREARPEAAPLDLAGRRGLASLLTRVFGHEQTTEKFGRYEVGPRLGAGAFGEVYESTDPRLDRKVALKLLHRGATSVQIERLRREAQAMAQVEHPNLVAVFEIGHAEDRDFIAMELVAGTTLAGWAEGNPADDPGRWRRALAMLLAAGRGLVAAHERGVVHRDFKPANVLVGEDGVVKVADFGLASIGAPDSTTDSPERHSTDPGDDPPLDSAHHRLTLTGTVMGTPRYMSPEQHRGAVADLRSDQFCFAVSAWEVLHGVPPFTASSLPGLLADIEQGSMSPPAVAAVPGAVNTVLRRAMAVNPAGRHPSMKHLLAALSRASTAPRRRAGLLAATLGVAAGALAIGFAMRGDPASSTARCDPEDARAEAQRVWNDTRRQAVARALADTAVPYAETTRDTVERTLDEFTAEWAEARTDACRSTWIEATAPPEDLDRRVACLRDGLANAEALVVRLEGATAALAQRAPSAAAALPSPARCSDPGMQVRDDSPRTRAWRDQLAQARAARLLGEHAESAAMAEAVAHEAEAAAIRSVQGEALEEWSRAQHAVDHGTASPQIEQAHAIALELDDAEASAVRALEAASQTRNNERDRAETWFRHADAAIARQTDPSAELRARRQQVECEVMNKQRLPEVALAACQRARTILDEDPGEHARLRWQLSSDMANTLNLMGRNAERAVILAELRERAIARHGRFHPRVAGTTMNLGNTLRAMGDYDRAVEMLKESEELFTRAYAPDHQWVISSMLNRSSTLLSLRRYDEALAVTEQALQRHGDRRDTRTLGLLYTMAETHRRAGQLDEADRYLDRVEALEEELLPPEHPQRAESQHCRGMIAKQRKQWSQARARFQRALELQRDAPSNLQAAMAHTMLADIALEEGKYADAEASARRVESILEKASGRPSSHAANLLRLSISLAEQGKLDDAEQQIDTVTPIIDGYDGPGSAELKLDLAKLRARVADLRSGVAKPGVPSPPKKPSR